MELEEETVETDAGLEHLVEVISLGLARPHPDRQHDEFRRRFDGAVQELVETAHRLSAPFPHDDRPLIGRDTHE